MGIWHIRDHLFGYLDHETLETCRQVSDFWDESLEKLSLVKFMIECGKRSVIESNVEDSNEKVCALPGWAEAAQKYGAKASIKDLREMKVVLQGLLIKHGHLKKEWTAFHLACHFDEPKLARLIMESSKKFGIDLNAKHNYGKTAFHSACYFGKTEVARLLIESSKEFDIELNARNDYGNTALHFACIEGQIEAVKLLLENLIDIGIDIKAQDDDGETALDLVNEEIQSHENAKNLEDLKTVQAILEAEYEKSDAPEV